VRRREFKQGRDLKPKENEAEPLLPQRLERKPVHQSLEKKPESIKVSLESVEQLALIAWKENLSKEGNYLKKIENELQKENYLHKIFKKEILTHDECSALKDFSSKFIKNFSPEEINHIIGYESKIHIQHYKQLQIIESLLHGNIIDFRALKKKEINKDEFAYFSVLHQISQGKVNLTKVEVNKLSGYEYNRIKIMEQLEFSMKNHFESLVTGYYDKLKKEIKKIGDDISNKLSNDPENTHLKDNLDATILKQETILKKERIQETREILQKEYIEFINQKYNNQNYRANLDFINKNEQYFQENCWMHIIEYERIQDETLEAKLLRRLSAPNKPQGYVHDYVKQDFEVQFRSHCQQLKIDEMLNKEYYDNQKKSFTDIYVSRISKNHNPGDKNDLNAFKNELKSAISADSISEYAIRTLKDFFYSTNKISKCSMNDLIHTSLFKSVDQLEREINPIERLARGYYSRMWIDFVRSDVENYMRTNPLAIEKQSGSSSRSGDREASTSPS
jgi:hypothetical protein